MKDKIYKFRYILTVNGNSRILSIGIIKNKVSEKRLNAKEVLDPIDNTGWISPYSKCMKPNTITNISVTELHKAIEYCFGYAITSTIDTFDVDIEDKILTGRIENIKYDISDFLLPIELDSIEVTKGLANRYARHIVNTVVNKFKDVRGDKLDGKRLPSHQVLIGEYILN